MTVCAAYPPTTRIARAQPAQIGRLPFWIFRIVSSRIGIVPPSPMMSSIAPCRARKNESVTTKLGMRRRATSRPITVPTSMPVTMQAMTASGHAQPFWVSVTPMTAPLVPAV